MIKEVNSWHHFSIFDEVKKMVSGLLNTYGSRDQSDAVIYQHLLSRGISCVSFCFIPCVEQISGGRGGGCTLQTSNCRLEYLFTWMLGTFKLLFSLTLLSFSYHIYNIQFNYSSNNNVVNTFTAKGFSKTRPFMHLSKHVFGSI